jgi:hypothetical protein
MAKRDDSHEVGYKHPPRSTRFVKGRSGNPKGRPKGSQNLSTLISKAAQERIRVTLNGRTKRITKREAVVLQIVNKALSGEDRAAKEALNLFMIAETHDQDSAGSPSDPDERDEAVIKSLFKRIREASSEMELTNEPEIPDKADQ